MFGVLRNNTIPQTSKYFHLSRLKNTLPRVCTKQGELEGTIQDLPYGGDYASFKGIPYAKSTAGEFRFKGPRSVDKWDGVFKADKHGPNCPNWDLFTGEKIIGDESGLSLNVYSPDLSGSAPVMVWFHVGGFRSGSGDSSLYGPEYLVENGVVVVTVNFRLEALGLLCMHTKDAPGNAALKDQVLALKWVQDNIIKFGGDPGNVTIFGNSSGGVMCTYHLLSPMSKGLFHKMIAQSGTFFEEWTISHGNIERGLRTAKVLGKETDDVDEALNYLKTVPAEKLIKITQFVTTEEERLRGLRIFFCPVVEQQFEGQECFLPKHPADILEEGSFEEVPILTGYNKCDGTVFAGDFLKKTDVISKDYTRKLPKDFIKYLDPKLVEDVAKEVKEFYFKDKPLGFEVISDIVDLESDLYFSFGTTTFAKVMSRLSKAPVYFNRFSLDSELNMMKRFAGIDVNGPSHADDLFYMFKTNLNIEQGSQSWKHVKMVTKLWTNFAKFGNPTPDQDADLPKWEPVSPEVMPYMEIDAELKPGQNPDHHRYEFWKNLYRRMPKHHLFNRFI